jgi:hypothetical protein
MKNDILLFITISLGITILSLIPPQFVYAFDTSPVRHEADEVLLKSIRQASVSKKLGIDLSPKGIGNQALHPEGQLHFLITINQHILVSTLCTNIIDLRMVSESHDQIYAEEVVLHENSILQRSISVQRPNLLIVFV